MSEKKINQIKDMLKQHYESTRPMDDYFTGMYNGIEAALALIEHREPEYKSVEHRPLEQRALIAEKRLEKISSLLKDILKYDQNCDCGADKGNGSQVDMCYFHELASITVESGE